MGELRRAMLRAPSLRPEPSATGALRLVKPAGDQPPPEAALEELERLLASSDFDGTPRSRDFLRFILEETLGGRQDGLSQTALATHVFGRRQDFDPTIDPIVRIQAGRLRRSLERYYLLSGAADRLRIELPRGSYLPLLRWATPSEKPAPQPRAERRAPTADGRPCVVVSLFEHGSQAPALPDAAALLNDLLHRATTPDRVYRHEWEQGDVVIWDNRGVLHRALPYDPASPRDMHRTTFAGDEPIQ